MTKPMKGELDKKGESPGDKHPSNLDRVARTPKAIELLKLLDDEEFSSLKEQLVIRKKLRLLILMERCWEIRFNDFSIASKMDLFEQVFSEKYSEKKDYLLRNEFRHLSEQIESFLVQKEVYSELDQDQSVYGYYLLRALQDRKALKLFKLEYQDAYERALTHADYHAAQGISRLNFINFSQYLELKKKDEEMLDHLNDLRLTHLSCYYLAAYRNIQIDQEHARSSFYPFSLIEDPLPKDVEVDFSEYENDYSVYLYHKAQSFVVNDTEKLKILKQCLSYVKRQAAESELFQEELKFCLSSLANTHASLHDFKRAQEIYEQYFALKTERDDPQRLTVLCDRIATMVSSRSFKTAIAFIDDNREELSGIEKHKTRVLSLEIAIRAFLRVPEDLRTLLPINFKGYSSRSKCFFKFYFSIYSYLGRDLESAHNEVLNMKNTRIINEELELRSVLNFFIRFYYIQLNSFEDTTKRNSLLIKLASDITSHTQIALPSVRSYLPYLWLSDELDRILTSCTNEVVAV